MEAELYAVIEACKQVVWLRGLLSELHMHQHSATRIYTDARTLLDIAKEPILHARTKHFRLRQGYLRDLVTDGVVKLIHIPGTENVADILTKPLPKPQFEYLRNKFMGNPSDVDESLSGRGKGVRGNNAGDGPPRMTRRGMRASHIPPGRMNFGNAPPLEAHVGADAALAQHVEAQQHEDHFREQNYNTTY